MTATEIRNVTGITDDAMLNAACETERKEDLGSEIAAKIVKAHGYDRGLYNGHVFDFGVVTDILAKCWFVYAGADNDNECHYFKSKTDEIVIYPTCYYPKLGKFRFKNFLLS